MAPNKSKGTTAHGRKNPPSANAKAAAKKGQFGFVAVRPKRPGHVVTAIAKRPAPKE